MYKIALFFFFALLLIGCDHKKVDSTPKYTIKIDSLNLQYSIKASQLFDTCKNIFLETTEESLIGKIDKIQIIGDRIYILDSEIAKSLFIFSKEGKFLFKIRHIGKGPGEFVMPDDFTINEDKIYINSRLLRKMLVYNLNGSFINELPVPSISFSFSMLSGNSFFFYTCGVSDLKYQIIESDAKGKIVDRYLPYETSNKNYPGCFMTSQGNFFKTKTGMNVSLPFSDMIYEISSKGITPIYFIDFAQYRLPESFIEANKKNPKLASLIADSHFAYSIGNVSENDEWVFLKFFLNSQNYKLFYHKGTKEVICAANVINDMGEPFFSDIITLSGEYMIAVFQPYQLHKDAYNMEKKNDHNHAKPSTSIVDKMSDTDNPILMLLNFKRRR